MIHYVELDDVLYSDYFSKDSYFKKRDFVEITARIVSEYILSCYYAIINDCTLTKQQQKYLLQKLDFNVTDLYLMGVEHNENA